MDNGILGEKKKKDSLKQNYISSLPQPILTTLTPCIKI